MVERHFFLKKSCVFLHGLCQIPIVSLKKDDKQNHEDRNNRSDGIADRADLALFSLIHGRIPLGNKRSSAIGTARHVV